MRGLEGRAVVPAMFSYPEHVVWLNRSGRAISSHRRIRNRRGGANAPVAGSAAEGRRGTSARGGPACWIVWRGK